MKLYYEKPGHQITINFENGEIQKNKKSKIYLYQSSIYLKNIRKSENVDIIKIKEFFKYHQRGNSEHF